jgi:hypothetical protein
MSRPLRYLLKRQKNYNTRQGKVPLCLSTLS